MRCHIASLVWTDRCLPLSSTIERIEVELGEIEEKKDPNSQTSHRCSFIKSNFMSF